LEYYVGLLEAISFPLAIISFLVLIFYYLYFFSRLYFHENKETSFIHPISIIICAKNELENLRKNLPFILSQNYFNFEVIVVNDHSNDDSILFLEKMAKDNRHLVIVDINDSVTDNLGKKFALTLGIKTAKHEYILLTDADCVPNSRDWVKKMSANFNNAEIVLGYGSYEKKKGFLNQIIRFDTFYIAQQYLSYVLTGDTYMGVGRNLAYKKSLFFENKGFASHMHIPSGDDDLFIQEIALKNTVAIEFAENTHTTSEVIEDWRDWVYQKRRHLSTAPMYKIKFKVLLALYPLSQLLFLTSVILLIVFEVYIFYVILLLVIRLVVSYLLNYRIMKRLNVYDLYWTHPAYEVFHLLIQGFFVLLNLFEKPKKWSR
jgi:glycosyltransferase involved in cell wall biosynthesis